MSRKWIITTMVLTCLLTFLLLKIKPLLPRPAESAELGVMSVVQPLAQVLVTGAVRQPGIYRLPKGSLVYDLVQLAGGLTPEANIPPERLALPVPDQGSVAIPSLPPSQPSQAPGPKPAQAKKTTGKMALNSATAADLTRLPGIGKKLAARIVAYRTQKGVFRRIDDLLKIPGIGKKRLQQLKPHLDL